MTEGLPNVRRITSKLLLRYKANLEASETSWNNVDWEEYELESGPGGNTENTIIKIVNSCPVWKEVFEEQKATRPNYCNVKIHGSDGYALAHLIFLQHVSGLVRSHVEAQVAEGDPPPSPKNILGVTLDDVKVEDIRTILNLLYCGSTIVNHANGSEVIRIMQLLKIFNLTLEHEPRIGKGIELDGFQQQVRVYHYKRRELGNAESSAVQKKKKKKQTPLQHLVKIESIELPVCYFCKVNFQTEDELNGHLGASCGRSLYVYFDLYARFCKSCKCSYKDHNAVEFMEHVGCCVGITRKHRKRTSTQTKVENTDEDDSEGEDEIAAIQKYLAEPTPTTKRPDQDLARGKETADKSCVELVTEGQTTLDGKEVSEEAKTIAMDKLKVRRPKPGPLSKTKIGSEIKPLSPNGVSGVSPLKTPATPASPATSNSKMNTTPPSPTQQNEEQALFAVPQGPALKTLPKFRSSPPPYKLARPGTYVPPNHVFICSQKIKGEELALYKRGNDTKTSTLVNAVSMPPKDAAFSTVSPQVPPPPPHLPAPNAPSDDVKPKLDVYSGPEGGEPLVEHVVPKKHVCPRCSLVFHSDPDLQKHLSEGVCGQQET